MAKRTTDVQAGIFRNHQRRYASLKSQNYAGVLLSAGLNA
jgi:hypothetical protein